MIVIGIDPGLYGAVAIRREWSPINEKVRIFDTPTAVIEGKNKYLISSMVSIFETFANRKVHAFLEKVHSMPKQGVSSTFSLGYGFGLWEGILVALKIPYTLVEPQRWKKAMLNGMGKDKDASRIRAMQLFPQLSEQLKRKKDHGRAEALLIAQWGLLYGVKAI